ncbi:hypothetical protein ACSBR2_031092 [Camellia fascicularis]
MAGMLPGVEIHRRRSRTTNPQRLHEDTPYAPGHPFYRSMMPTSTSAMDETAIKARQRLAQKLGYFRLSRVNRFQSKEGRGREGSDAHLVSRIIGRPWHFQSNNTSQSKGQLCVVCLEDFGAEHKQVMELPCSHKYHSKCLQPWLAAHPNCPSCRSPVLS